MRTRSLILTAILLCASLVTSRAVTKADESTANSKAPGAQFAHQISTITGVAISPLLGTSAYGAVKWWKTPKDKRAALPWFAQPWFWVPASLLVAACFVKDTAGTALPTVAKKPLDVAEAVEHKISGLVATGAFVPFIAMMSQDSASSHAMLSSMGFAAADFSWLYDIIMVPLMMAAFFIVFLASNAINILILLSPFTTVDAALKAARTALLGTVVASAWVNPWIGAAWALIIIGVAWLISGWSFRLSHFGLVFIWDFFTLRRTRFTPDAVVNKMFLGRKLNKVPARTYGLLGRDGGKLIFRYRPWLVLPGRVLELPDGKYAAGRGLFYSEIVRMEGDDAKTVFLLPPRYRGHEEQLAKLCGFAGVREVGLRAAWKWFKELFTGRAQPEVRDHRASQMKSHFRTSAGLTRKTRRVPRFTLCSISAPTGEETHE